MVKEKRFGIEPVRTPNEKAKQVRFLQSRGFQLDLIFQLEKAS